MRSFKCVFALVGILAIGYWIVRRFTTSLIDGINYKEASLEFNNISSTGVNLKLLLSFSNDTAINVPIDSFSGYIKAANVSIARVELVQPIVLTAHDITSIPITTSIKFIDIGIDLANAIISKSLNKDLTVEGFINIKGFTKEVKYPLISLS